MDRDIIATLTDGGYSYDSSILPGPAGLMMKVYMTMIGRGGNGKSFGPWTSIFASQRPARIDGTGIWEFPIATLPALAMADPFHVCVPVRRRLLDAAIARLKRNPGHHVYQLHAIDGLDHPSPGALAKLVIPLQRTFSERREFLHRLGSLIEGRVELTEEIVAAAA